MMIIMPSALGGVVGERKHGDNPDAYPCKLLAPGPRWTGTT